MSWPTEKARVQGNQRQHREQHDPRDRLGHVFPSRPSCNRCGGRQTGGYLTGNGNALVLGCGAYRS
jgi:hypothetical protein